MDKNMEDKYAGIEKRFGIHTLKPSAQILFTIDKGCGCSTTDSDAGKKSDCGCQTSDATAGSAAGSCRIQKKGHGAYKTPYRLIVRRRKILILGDFRLLEVRITEDADLGNIIG